jgi:L-threonylcarbamoyladenylate synthase
LKTEDIKEAIVIGKLFIHPTDTIYGIGCNARSPSAIKEVRKLKKREDTPFSIMAPSKQWIIDNFEITEEAKKWLDKLPGPYTLILKKKNPNCIAKEVAPGLDTIGVRMPAHWFAKIVEKLNIPIITTSANQTGKIFMTSLEDLDPEIEKGIDFIIYEGEKKGKPSEIIDLTKAKTEIRKR